MTKIKTSELTGSALDRAVDLANGFAFQKGMPESEWSRDEDCKPGFWRRSPGDGHWTCMRCSEHIANSTDWSQGGPIIEREKLALRYDQRRQIGWEAFMWSPSQHDLTNADCNRFLSFGPTALIAAMRCFVASKLGDEVEIPNELL